MSHQQTARMGFWRFLAHECVRANPLYVISAMFMAWSVLRLTRNVNNEISGTTGILLAIGFLVIYQVAVFTAASVILHRRSDGGRDLHGLLIVATLFVGITYIAIDQLAVVWYLAAPAVMGPLLVATAVLMVAYARLPGLNLPRRYIIAGMILLFGQSLGTTVSAPTLLAPVDDLFYHRLVMLIGWVSMLPLIWLAVRPDESRFSPREDVLRSGRPGPVMIGLLVAIALLKLRAGDYVFKRPTEYVNYLPALLVIGTVLFAVALERRRLLGAWRWILSAVPFALAAFIWGGIDPSAGVSTPALTLSAPAQMLLAAAMVYAAGVLVWRRRIIHLGLGALLIIPLAGPLWRSCRQLPAADALASAGVALAMLIGGLLISVYRDRLLAWLAGEPPLVSTPPASVGEEE